MARSQPKASTEIPARSPRAGTRGRPATRRIESIIRIPPGSRYQGASRLPIPTNAGPCTPNPLYFNNLHCSHRDLPRSYPSIHCGITPQSFCAAPSQSPQKALFLPLRTQPGFFAAPAPQCRTKSPCAAGSADPPRAAWPPGSCCHPSCGGFWRCGAARPCPAPAALDRSAARDHPAATAASTTFWSSRTLPGNSWAIRRLRVSAGMRGAGIRSRRQKASVK